MDIEPLFIGLGAQYTKLSTQNNVGNLHYLQVLKLSGDSN